MKISVNKKLAALSRCLNCALLSGFLANDLANKITLKLDLTTILTLIRRANAISCGYFRRRHFSFGLFAFAGSPSLIVDPAPSMALELPRAHSL